MLSLTYLSTAVEPFDAGALTRLLEVSRRNNHAAGLTGMLLYVDGHFIQALEGDADVVDETFATISGDPRHRDVLVAIREEVATRSFPDWSMGFEDVDAEQAAAIPGFSDFLTSRNDQPPADLGRAGIFLRIFRDRMR